MNKFIVFFAGLLLISCTKRQEVIPSITFLNPSSFERIAEPIVISQSKINSILGDNNSVVIYFEDENGNLIPFQKDNLYDKVEYSLSIDFDANQSKKVFIKIADASYKSDFTAYTNIRLGKDANADGIYDDIHVEVRDPNHLPGAFPVLYQAEGISWENDKVGFRSYWDKRNGKDIWGKTTDKMVLDSVGLPNTPSYHEIEHWGADVLKVGNSLGAGALAMVRNDKLIRLGATDVASFKVLTEGPVRAILTLDYKGWNVDGESFDITETISIWKGKYGYKSDVVLKGSNQKIVTGIVNIHLENDGLQVVNPNENYNIIYTFGTQSEFKDNLGLGLILDTNELVVSKKAPNTGAGTSIDGNSPISHTYYAEMQSENNEVSFYFFAGWEKSNQEFSTKKGFENMLINEANKLNNPIIIE